MADTGINWDLVLSDQSIKDAFRKVEEQAKKSGKKVDEALSPKESGSSGILGAFGKIGAGLVVMNQGLELAEKGFRQVRKAIELMVDSIKEADHIRLVNTQFDILTVRAGVAGDTLRDAFAVAVKGSSDMTEVLSAANRALIDLGVSADRLPALFDLARKSAKLTGNEVIPTFEALSGAIQSSNTRSLRQVGLFIDSEKALNDFAKTMGVTANQLSLAGRQQAILNAVLEQGQKSFQGLEGAADTNTEKLSKLSVAFKDLGDSISLRLSSIFGPLVGKLTELATSAIGGLAEAITTNKGTIETQIGEITQSLAGMNAELQSLKDQQKRNPLAINLIAEQVQLGQKIRESEKALASLRIAFDDAQKAAARGAKAGPSLIQLPTVQETQAANVAYQQALQNAFASNVQLQVQQNQLLTDEDLKQSQTIVLVNLQRLSLEGEHQLRVEQIRKTFADRRLFTEAQSDQLIEAENARHKLALELLDENSAASREKRAKELAGQLKSIVVSGLSSTFQEVGKRLQSGQGLFDDFGKGVVGIIGDFVIKLGEALIFQGIAMEKFILAINKLLPGSGFAAAAAGVGLIIFGSALKASVGQGGGGSTGAGGGGATGGPGAGETTVTATEDLEPQGPSAQVVFNVNGNIIPRDRQFAQEIADTLTEVGFSQGVEIIGASA